MTEKDENPNLSSSNAPAVEPDHPLLERLSELESPPIGSEDGPGRALLEAYRRGELSPEDASDLERRLARDGVSRSRLLALGGHEMPSPSPFLRARVLRAHKEATQKKQAKAGSSGHRPRRRTWAPMLVAALLVLSVAGVLLRGGFGTGELPADLTYEVTARGLADVRSDGAAPSEWIEAEPGTLVEWVVAPTGIAEGDVEFAIYRRQANGSGWIRVADSERAVVNRGTAVFELSASELVGTEPGDYELLVVVGRPGQLPLRLEAGDDVSDEQRRIYRKKLRLRP